MVTPESLIALPLRKQHLAPGYSGAEVVKVMDDLLGLHATDRLSPYLQLLARIDGFAAEQLDRPLEAGRATRLPCMRGSLFIESAEMAALAIAATREQIRRRHDPYLTASGLTRRRYERIASRLEEALEGRALDARSLREEIGARDSLSPVLVVMCDEARLVRWRAAAGWRGAPPTYRRFDEALPGVRPGDWSDDDARRALVGRYVRRYGPVDEDDVAWWTGLGKSRTRAALASLPEIVRAADGMLIHESDVAESQRLRRAPAAQVALLPLLDPYLQGYRDRSRFIDARWRDFVIDRSGNTTSTVVVGGRVAGVWDCVDDPAPELRLLLFERAAPRARRMLRALAAEVGGFITGRDARVTEVGEMQPLTRRRAGAVLSPLRL